MKVDDPFALLEARGDRLYGEALCQREHALQAALLAFEAGAPPSMVCAALLHDIGHLVTAEDSEQDAQHEEIGAKLLARWFPDSVTEPVRLHVMAKRELARDPAYQSALSSESLRSLKLQGGPLSARASKAFAAQPFAQRALQLRRWDDQAKRQDLRVPQIARWRRYLRAEGLI